MFVQGFDTPEIRALEAESRRLEVRVAEAAGVINAAHGRLVEVAAAVIADPRVALGPGVHSPAAWLAWKAGISRGRAADIERLARRAGELPCTVAALVGGTIALDQAAVIARHVPGRFEAAACDAGKHLTVAQLRRTLPDYGYEPPSPEEPATEVDRSVSSGVDEKGWWLKARLTPDEGAVVDQAIAAIRDDLFRIRRNDLLPGETGPEVAAADGLVCVAEAALRGGQARFPGTDRYLVHAHLEASPDPVEVAKVSLHLGTRLPRWIQELLTCDPTVRLVIEDHGTPVNVGRATRAISRRLRRLIEHRDGGCVVPGCDARHGLEIHHIHHWEYGGPTDTDNLATLCRRHHRAHHQDIIHVTGNPDLPTGSPGALAVSDQRGHPMEASGLPTPPVPGTAPAATATAIGITAHRYQPPYNERLSHHDFYLQPTPASEPVSAVVDVAGRSRTKTAAATASLRLVTDPPGGIRSESAPPGPSDRVNDDSADATSSGGPDQPWSRAPQAPVPGSPPDRSGRTDPTRAGPPARG